MELSGRVACITGGGSGIGRAAALRLARAGADIALLGRTRDELEEVRQEVVAQGRAATVLVADVADAPAMADAFAAIKRQFGQIDVLFANAGVNGVWAPIVELTPAEWDATLGTNLGGTFLSLHFALPLMMGQGGTVIITASINGTRSFTSAGASAYAASKAGQLAFGKMAALELARYGIRVNVICPGAIDTQISDNTHARDVADAAVPATYPEGQVPLTKGQSGKSGDVAELVLFLASDRSRHITGTEVYIDGGQSLLV